MYIKIWMIFIGREDFKSRSGSILVSAGCTIGIGNVWRFPYVVRQNGEGLFVLLYLVFLFIMGVPFLTMDLAVGYARKKVKRIRKYAQFIA